MSAGPGEAHHHGGIARTPGPLGHRCSGARQHHIAEWAEQIKVSHAHTVCLAGRSVPLEVVEKMAVVGHLLLDLTVRCLDLLRVDAGSGRECTGGGQRGPELGAAGCLAGAGRSVILGEDVQRVTVRPDQEDDAVLACELIFRPVTTTLTAPRWPGSDPRPYPSLGGRRTATGAEGSEDPLRVGLSVGRSRWRFFGWPWNSTRNLGR
jgi:hypothetical protein